MSIGFNISYLQDVIDTLEGRLYIFVLMTKILCVVQDNQDMILLL